MILFHLSLWHHLQGWFHFPKTHEAKQANLNLVCLDQLEASTVTKYQWTNKMQKKELEKTHIYTYQEGPFCQLQTHCRVDTWQIQMWRKSSCTGDSGCEKSKDPIKYWHEFSVLAKERWDATLPSARQWLPLQSLLLFNFSHSMSSFHWSCKPWEQRFGRSPWCFFLMTDGL